MDVWVYIWLGWLAIFAVVEGVALTNKREGDTLSEHVWRWFDITRESQPSGFTRFRRFSLLAGMVWLLAHFLSGGYF